MFCWTVANNLNSVRFDASLTQVAWTLTLRWRVLIGQYQVTWPYYTRKPDTRANRDTGIHRAHVATATARAHAMDADRMASREYVGVEFFLRWFSKSDSRVTFCPWCLALLGNHTKGYNKRLHCIVSACGSPSFHQYLRSVMPNYFFIVCCTDNSVNRVDLAFFRIPNEASERERRGM